MSRKSFKKIIIAFIFTFAISITLTVLFFSSLNAVDDSVYKIIFAIILMIAFIANAILIVKVTKIFSLDLKINDIIVTHLEDAILITDSQNLILYANYAFELMAGFKEAELIGKNPNILKSGTHGKKFYDEMWQSIEETGYWEGEIVDKNKNGQFFTKMMKIFVIKNKKGKIIRYISIQSNIEEIKQLKHDAYNLEFYSELTKLPNMKKLSKDYLDLIKIDKEIGIYYIKVTNQVNIESKVLQSGYAESLLYLIESIRTSLPYNKTKIYEYDESTFVVLIKDNAADHNSAISNIISQTNSINVDGNIISLTIKVGVTEYPKYGTQLSDLITSAKISVNSILNDPYLNYLTSSRKIEEETKEELEIQTDLIYAINNKKLKVYYQPQIDSKTRKVIGLEALVRWNHPVKGYISPEVFINIAEKHGLINELDIYVFKQVRKDYELISQFNSELTVSINIGLMSLINDDFLKMISGIIEHENFPVDKIIIELTETQTTSDIEKLVTRSKMIKDLGFRLSLDDFGTGYNALAVLFNVDFDEIKIDRSFIKEEMNEKDESILKGMLDLGNSIGVKIVAEGVETDKQALFLEKHNCDILQGYLYSKALNIKKVLEFIENNL